MAIPVISVQQMRDWEQASWRAGCKEQDVIENVGHALARRLLSLTSENDRVLILAGKGHNGDDGRAAVRHLLQRKVKLIDVLDPTETLAQLPKLLVKKPRVIVDALFGIGLNRPLAADWARLMDAIHRSGSFILAVDVPSGLNADTGLPEGAAMRADLTLTVGAVKRGLLNAPQTGRLEVARDIGLVSIPFSGDLYWTEPTDFDHLPPRRPVDSHKGTYGHLGILAGSIGYHGAAVLCARGAQRSRPGLITLCTLPEVYVPIASQLQSVMVHPWPPQIKLSETCSALVIGPGLASSTASTELKSWVRELWLKYPKPMIVDASALEWLEPSAPLNHPRVITPHPGEAGRMLGMESAAIQSDRVAALRKLSDRFGNCWVVLKGNRTLVGRASGDVFVNSSGNPYLAQGGSGDLLAGYIGGFLAQPGIDFGLAVRYAIWSHGASADKLPGNWTVEDLAAQLGASTLRHGPVG